MRSIFRKGEEYIEYADGRYEGAEESDTRPVARDAYRLSMEPDVRAVLVDDGVMFIATGIPHAQECVRIHVWLKIPDHFRVPLTFRMLTVAAFKELYERKMAAGC